MKIFQRILVGFFCFLQIQTFARSVNLDTLLTPSEIVWLNQNKDNLRYAPNPSWPPGDYLDEKGVHRGIVSDYVKIFEEKLDVQFEKVYFKNWNDIYQGLLDSKVDFVGAMMKTEDREDLFNFTDVFLRIPIVILVRNDYQSQFSKENISSMKLAAVKGYITQNFVERSFQSTNIKEYDDDLTALLQTSFGNADGTIVDLMTACFLVEKYGISNLSIGTELDFTWELRFAFRKEQAVFASIVTKVLNTISKEERSAIFSKWVNINYITTPSFFVKHMKSIIATAVFFLFVFILVFNYTILLQKQVKKRTLELNRELKEKNEAIALSKKNESRFESLFEISQRQEETIDELLEYSINEAIILTGSKIGILFMYNKVKRTFSINTLLSNENEKQHLKQLEGVYTTETLCPCMVSMIQDQIHYKLNYSSSCEYYKSGSCPFKSLNLTHELIVPVVEDGDLEAIILLGNKESAYDYSDVKQVILLLNSFWKLLSKQRWQEELIEAKERAEESDRLKTAFLASMSHEIRTPMNGILGFAELLKESDLTGEQQQQYIDIILQSGDRMVNLINELVDISKIETGLIELNINEVDVCKLSRNLFGIYKIAAEEKGLEMIFKPIIAVNEAMIIRTDMGKLNTIISSLINNALKYTSKGRIEFGFDLKDELIEFFVKDTGVGIEKSRQKAIFDRFVYADIENRQAYQGAGLGLSISKAYVEMLGGTIWVDSEKENGSTFYFTIRGDL